MTAACPDCGSALPKDAALMGLCPQCLLSMALEDDESPTLHGSSPRSILGERYQIREVLGRGGMGEVYRAFDLKLRVDVALKAVRAELSSSEKARELLRQEVRSAREVVSPNVCRIFDLVVEDGREHVSMEYIDGTTLAETLRTRGPLELREAREIAAQFLSGLEAIHEAGLVHRDFKPENVMLTRAGRVVVMDFGLAKAGSEKSQTIAGTPAYMSPEQSRGESADARADVFSAGVVLSEMLWGDTRAALWNAVRESPPRVPEGPWATVLRQALSSDRESRHATARALARALDEVTHRLPGFEDRHPYPGLASFTKEDAEYFFGREAEVEAVWKKLKRPRLLALIGPSGAGKSSFLRAGLLPTLPSGWSVLVSTPGHRPYSALAESLLPAFAGDMQAIQSFLRFDEPETALSLFSAWRQKSEHALVIVDQFEELFTLNSPEVQEAFATLLGRLVLEADVHVLLSFRDDFLLHCQNHEALSPVFSELTALGTLSPSALRRALVQPALACGYRFEDDALVEEMVSEVSREKGVLPLLAFAASRLWEKRDREKGLLTREAYQEIGGVGGALAQHAEETLSRIGEARTPLVRELFRNLVTSQGTRASREVEELLSIFQQGEERNEAEEVLRELIGARLLTSYDTSVEIIHESLLTAWPRLVRWRNEDEGGALLRDQLRQAAQAWHDRGRPDDLLWTGKSYRELSLWRESYTGGLSSMEGGFANAAAKLAGRTRRRRRIASAASFALLLGVVAVVTSLWRRAVLEVSRREAAQILALGRVQLEDRPTAALAHALASLERADSAEARRFAVEALWHGAAAIVLPGNINTGDFSPDGEWLATDGFVSGVRLWSREGGPPRTLGGPDPDGTSSVQFDPESTLLAAGGETARFWSVPDGKEIRTVDLDGQTLFFRRGPHLLSASFVDTSVTVRDWRDRATGSDVIAFFDSKDLNDWDFDSSGERLLWGRGKEVHVSPLRDFRHTPSLLAGEHKADVIWIASDPSGPRVVSGDKTGGVRIWRFSDESAHLERTIRAPEPNAVLDATGSWLTVARNTDSTRNAAYVWDLKGPPDWEPAILRDREAASPTGRALHQEGAWLFTAHNIFGGILWPLDGRYPRTLRTKLPFLGITFTPDAKSLVSTSDDGAVRLWPLSADAGRTHRILFEDRANPRLGVFVEVDPGGEFALVTARFTPRVLLVPLKGGKPRPMPEIEAGNGWVQDIALSPDGRLVAVAGSRPPIVRLWEPKTGKLTLLDLRRRGPHCWGDAEPDIFELAFLTNRELLTFDAWGIRLWNLDEETHQDVRPCQGKGVQTHLKVLKGSRRFLVLDRNEPERASEIGLYDLESKTFRKITTHGNRVFAATVDSTGTLVVTGDWDGVVRVGPITGEDPHLLIGDSLAIASVSLSPDGRWIASGSQDGTIRLWPMPEGVPFQTLSYEEILERIRGLTNLRVVPDASSDTGYRVEIGPFPGWAKLPQW